MRIEAIIPPNTTATIRLPGADLQDIPDDYKITQDEQGVLVEVGSGSYTFEYPYRMP